MRVLFCETTSDISLLLTRKQVVELRRTKECTPSFEAESKGLLFHLMGTQSKEYIKVREPRRDYNHYWVLISDSAYEDLVRSDECGTRYGNSSKVKVCVNEDL
jgi:hypothetical protein